VGDTRQTGGRTDTPQFEHEVVRERTAVVRITGELDIGSADALRDALDRAESTHPDAVRLDAGGVNFLDSTALGVILACAHRLAERGARLELVCTSPGMRRILDMTMISRTVHLIP
jgi:anti-anti-sigma factor